jgi:hypothetical protein
MRSRRGRGGTIADERRAFRYRQHDRAISLGLADYRLGVLALGSAAQQVAAPTPRYRALMKSSRSRSRASTTAPGASGLPNWFCQQVANARVDLITV